MNRAFDAQKAHGGGACSAPSDDGFRPLTGHSAPNGAAAPYAEASGGSLTSEQFFMREMRLVAALRVEGVSDADIAHKAVTDNMFRYPTDRKAARCAAACCRRLDALAGPAHERLVGFIVHGTPNQAAQANLYAMMRRYRLMRAFMVDEVGERLACLQCSLSRADMNAFFTRYQLECPEAAAWGESTVSRIKSTLSQCLVQVGYRLTPQADELSPVLVDPEIQSAICENGDAFMLVAFDGQKVAQ